MNAKMWTVFVVICVGLLGGLVWLSQGDDISVDSVDLFAIQTASADSGNIADHTFNNLENPKVTIIEYGDFQCGGCAAAAPILKPLVKKYSDNVELVYRHFPLSSIHPNARVAAAGAEAAGKQDKFWEMHDILFENQADWEKLGGEDRVKQLSRYAEQLDLDVTQFQADLDSQSITSKINFDIAMGKKIGVTGTPAIFVNGKEANQTVKDGKITTSTGDGTQIIWANQEAFENLLIIPALREAGVPAKNIKQ